MRKGKQLLSVFLALFIVALLTGSALASETRMTEVTAGTMVVIPYTTTAIASDSDGNGYYEDVAYYSLTYTSDNLTAGNDYMLMVVKSSAYDGINGYTINPDNIIYIDQVKAVADNTDVSLTFPSIYPSSITNCHVLLGGTFNNLVSSPCKIAEISSATVTLQSIAITTPATKLIYTVGDTLDITGLVVTRTYCDGGTEAESITAANVTGFNSSAPAVSQTLTITIDGQTTTYTISIITAQNSSISPTTAPFDKNISAQADINITLILYGNTLTSITNETATLVLDTDYSVSENTVSIKKDYLTAQEVGTTILIFNFSAGDCQTITITVSDSTIMQQASIPEATPESGEVLRGTQVSLTTATEGAAIYYTIDGNNPTVQSTVYSAETPIVINSDTILKAMAVKDAVYSQVMTATYTLSDTEAVASAKDYLIYGTISGVNTASNNITSNLSLPSIGLNGTTISWTVAPAGIIAADGSVIRPAVDTEVTLTATISKGTTSDTKEFVVTVKAAISNQPGFNISSIPNNTLKLGDDFFDMSSDAMNDPQATTMIASLLKDGINKNIAYFKFGGKWYAPFELTEEQFLDPAYALTDPQVNAIRGFNKWYKAGSEIVDLRPGTYTITPINQFSSGFRITANNVPAAAYFNVYKTSSSTLINSVPIAIGSSLNSMPAVFSSISDLEVWIYSDAAGTNKIVELQLEGSSNAGILDYK